MTEPTIEPAPTATLLLYRQRAASALRRMDQDQAAGMGPAKEDVAQYTRYLRLAAIEDGGLGTVVI